MHASFQILAPVFSQMSIQIPIPMPFQISGQMSVKSEDLIIFHVPTPFPYTDAKYIPYNYTTITYERENPIVLDTTVTNITGVGGMTQSGRVFVPELPLKTNIPKNSKGKEAVRLGKGPSKKGVP